MPSIPVPVCAIVFGNSEYTRDKKWVKSRAVLQRWRWSYATVEILLLLLANMFRLPIRGTQNPVDIVRCVPACLPTTHQPPGDDTCYKEQCDRYMLYILIKVEQMRRKAAGLLLHSHNNITCIYCTGMIVCMSVWRSIFIITLSEHGGYIYLSGGGGCSCTDWQKTGIFTERLQRV